MLRAAVARYWEFQHPVVPLLHRHSLEHAVHLPGDVYAGPPVALVHAMAAVGARWLGLEDPARGRFAAWCAARAAALADGREDIEAAQVHAVLLEAAGAADAPERRAGLVSTGSLLADRLYRALPKGRPRTQTEWINMELVCRLRIVLCAHGLSLDGGRAMQVDYFSEDGFPVPASERFFDAEPAAAFSALCRNWDASGLPSLVHTADIGPAAESLAAHAAGNGSALCLLHYASHLRHALAQITLRHALQPGTEPATGARHALLALSLRASATPFDAADPADLAQGSMPHPHRDPGPKTGCALLQFRLLGCGVAAEALALAGYARSALAKAVLFARGARALLHEDPRLEGGTAMLVAPAYGAGTALLAALRGGDGGDGEMEEAARTVAAVLGWLGEGYRGSPLAAARRFGEEMAKAGVMGAPVPGEEDGCARIAQGEGWGEQLPRGPSGLVDAVLWGSTGSDWSGSGWN
ncbi:hypothetical protein DFJ74DRAFT_702150 [Hyaloraphidium curvatum]|nr:hypothetical protein DFJ74DRAFT_702150 [Hyaloraphidium curvatum]